MERKRVASEYIRSNFRPEDRVAVVLIQKSSGHVMQRLSTAEQAAGEEFQRWLESMNAYPGPRCEVYLSMNTLAQQAHGRTKADIGEIRHVYLDFDVKGTEAVAAMTQREDIPRPNHLIESSPGKWQSVWRVQDFGQHQAETLMRGMVHELGADPAATDSSRVLRVPGFHNHKYGKPHLVRVENLNDEIYTPERFPRFDEDSPVRTAVRSPATATRERSFGPVGLTQSERDWAYAKRALARGDDPLDVVRAIASYRPEKPSPEYYAEHTVEGALAALNRPHPSAMIDADADAPER